MNVNDMFPSSYLKASDLQGRARLLTISGVQQEEIAASETKWVVHFGNAQKGMVLNPTNGRTLAGLFGPESNGWTGKEIELFPQKVPFKGQMVDSIRVRLPVPPAQPAAPQQPRAAQPQQSPAGVPPVDTGEDAPW